MKAQFKNYKTTLAGVISGVTLVIISEVEGGCLFTDWKCWMTPVAITLLGFLARDADKSTEQSK